MSDTAPRSAPAGARTPRWVWIVLVVSLAFNCLVIGAGAAALWRAPFFAHHFPGNFLRYAHQLPPEKREAVRSAFAAVRPEIRALRQDMRRARRDAAEIFVAEPFDKERFMAAQRRVLEAEQKFREALQRPIPEIAAQLNPEERRTFMRWRAARRSPTGRWLDQDGQGERKGDTPGKRQP